MSNLSRAEQCAETLWGYGWSHSCGNCGHESHYNNLPCDPAEFVAIIEKYLAQEREAVLVEVADRLVEEYGQASAYDIIAALRERSE